MPGSEKAVFRWCKLPCKVIGYVLAAAGLAVIILTLLPVWAIIGLIGLIFIVCGLMMIL